MGRPAKVFNPHDGLPSCLLILVALGGTFCHSDQEESTLFASRRCCGVVSIGFYLGSVLVLIFLAD